MKIRDMTLRDWGKFLFSTKGRISRFDFNIKFLAVVIAIQIVTLFIDYLNFGLDIIKNYPVDTPLMMGMKILFFVPFIVVSIKRLHDLNRSDWWLLTGYFFPAVIQAILHLMINYYVQRGTAVLPLIWWSLMITQILVLFWFFCFFILLSCVRGTRSPNRFGPNPNNILIPKADNNESLNLYPKE